MKYPKMLSRIALSLILTLCFCVCACTVPPAPETTPEPVPDITQIVSELDIPKYPEDSLYTDASDEQSFLSAPWCIGKDACWHDNTDAWSHETSLLLKYHPTDAIRSTDWGTKYLMYDLDSGYRLFYFTRRLHDNLPETLCGFPVVVGKLLPYSAFSELKIGDPIEKVIEIDHVAELHKKVIDVGGMVPEMAAEMAGIGRPCTSFHYLSDGVLKIEYEMLKDRSLIISNIVYSEDYRMETNFESLVSRVIDYRIDPRDLPQQ